MEGRTLCNYPSLRLRHVGVIGWGVGVGGAGRHAFTCPFSKLKAVSSSNRILPLRVTAGVGLDPFTSCRAPSHLYTSGCTSIATDGRLTDDGSRSHHLGSALKEREGSLQRTQVPTQGGWIFAMRDDCAVVAAHHRTSVRPATRASGHEPYGVFGAVVLAFARPTPGDTVGVSRCVRRRMCAAPRAFRSRYFYEHFFSFLDSQTGVLARGYGLYRSRVCRPREDSGIPRRGRKTRVNV